MADLATLQTWLMEAELAQHKLLTGSVELEVEHGDMRTKFSNSVTGMQQLASYISDLKARIAALGGAVTGERRRAISVNL